MSHLLSESVATVEACQCVDQPVRPATNRQRLVMVHPQWGIVATGDEFDPDDFDRIAADCKPALASITTGDPTSERPAESKQVDPHRRQYSGVLVIPTAEWEPPGRNSIPPLTIKSLPFRLANEIAAEWNRQHVRQSMYERTWHLVVKQTGSKAKKTRWGVLTVDVPRWFSPRCHRTLPPGILQDVPRGMGGYNGLRRRMNAERFLRPGPITEWAVVVHAPMI